eukprot:COSAG02_NODE_50881_length_317_cov_1.623853_1_plen_31_part_10
MFFHRQGRENSLINAEHGRVSAGLPYLLPRR